MDVCFRTFNVVMNVVANGVDKIDGVIPGLLADMTRLEHCKNLILHQRLSAHQAAEALLRTMHI